MTLSVSLRKLTCNSTASSETSADLPGKGVLVLNASLGCNARNLGQAPRIIFVVAAIVLVLKLREASSRHRVSRGQFQRGRPRVRAPLPARPRRSPGRYRRRGFLFLAFLSCWHRRHPASRAAYCTGIFRRLPSVLQKFTLREVPCTFRGGGGGRGRGLVLCRGLFLAVLIFREAISQILGFQEVPLAPPDPPPVGVGPGQGGGVGGVHPAGRGLHDLRVVLVYLARGVHRDRGLGGLAPRRRKVEARPHRLGRHVAGQGAVEGRGILTVVGPGFYKSARVRHFWRLRVRVERFRVKPQDGVELRADRRRGGRGSRRGPRGRRRGRYRWRRRRWVGRGMQLL